MDLLTPDTDAPIGTMTQSELEAYAVYGTVSDVKYTGDHVAVAFVITQGGVPPHFIGQTAMTCSCLSRVTVAAKGRRNVN